MFILTVKNTPEHNQWEQYAAITSVLYCVSFVDVMN